MTTQKTSLGPDFNKIWTTSLLTNLADGVLKLAAPLLAVSLTHNPVLVSLLSALAMLPWLFFAIPIGAYVDRVDRRRALVIGNAVRSIVGFVLSFMVLRDLMTIWVLLTAVFVIGVCEVLVDTTSQATLPQILNSSQFERGNSRLQISEVIVAQFAGSPLSGLLYATSIALPFFFATTGFVLAALLLTLVTFQNQMSLPKVESQVESKSLWEDVKFGLGFIAKNQAIRTIVLITTSIGFFYSFSTAVAPLFILKELKVAPSFFGVIFAVQGLGALSGSALAPTISEKFGRGRALAINLAVSASTVILMGISPNVLFFMISSMAMGFSISIWNILLMSVYQSLIPRHLFGRIHGARRTLVWGLMPLGSIIGGIVATNGLRTPFVIGGSIATLIAVMNMKRIVQIGDYSLSESSNSQ